MKNTKKGFIVPILISIIAILAIVGMYYYQKNSQTFKNETVDNINNTIATTSSLLNTQKLFVTEASTTSSKSQKIGSSSELLYVDKVSGYELKLPINWIGHYKVVNGIFQLPTIAKSWNGAYGDGYAEVFSVAKYTIDEWTKLVDDCKKDWGIGCKSDKDSIGRTSTTVFARGIPPTSGPTVEGDTEWGKLADEVCDDKVCNMTNYFKNNFSVITPDTKRNGN
jgi:hypothetical protein